MRVQKLRQNFSKTNDYDKGDLVRYYVTDPHGIVMEGGIGVVTDVFYNERSSCHLYRVLTQGSGHHLWFEEKEVVLVQKAS